MYPVRLIIKWYVYILHNMYRIKYKRRICDDLYFIIKSIWKSYSASFYKPTAVHVRFCHFDKGG